MTLNYQNSLVNIKQGDYILKNGKTILFCGVDERELYFKDNIFYSRLVISQSEFIRLTKGKNSKKHVYNSVVWDRFDM